MRRCVETGNGSLTSSKRGGSEVAKRGRLKNLSDEPRGDDILLGHLLP
ncbi:hypothetical protein QT06_C0001G0745 [archaeon GW2011_AR15]|nr:hypothetical protein QT06_C0001G0745 [archaeon GW2011_AR15]